MACLNTLLPPDEIKNIEQLRQRRIFAERDLATKMRLIDKLEQAIAPLAQLDCGRSSEKHPGQGDMTVAIPGRCWLRDDSGIQNGSLLD